MSCSWVHYQKFYHGTQEGEIQSGNGTHGMVCREQTICTCVLCNICDQIMTGWEWICVVLPQLGDVGQLADAIMTKGVLEERGSQEQKKVV